MIVGIVGHEAAKFTAATEAKARSIIRELLADPAARLTSGHCHLGGIDIWAEEEAERLGRTDALIFPPKTRAWATGYKPRNIKIAEAAGELHNIVVAEYPESYRGMRFDLCYHCGSKDHIKSGGCWTAKYAQRLGKPAVWHIV